MCCAVRTSPLLFFSFLFPAFSFAARNSERKHVFTGTWKIIWEVSVAWHVIFRRTLFVWSSSSAPARRAPQPRTKVGTRLHDVIFFEPSWTLFQFRTWGRTKDSSREVFPVLLLTQSLWWIVSFLFFYVQWQFHNSNISLSTRLWCYDFLCQVANTFRSPHMCTLEQIKLVLSDFIFTGKKFLWITPKEVITDFAPKNNILMTVPHRDENSASAEQRW